MWIEHTSVGKVHILKQCSTDRLNNGPLDLVLQAIRIYHRTTVPGLDHTCDPHGATCRVHRHLGAGRDVSALFESAGDTQPS